MSLKEEAKKEYDDLIKQETHLKNQIKQLRKKIKPIETYLKEVGIVERKTRKTGSINATG